MNLLDSEKTQCGTPLLLTFTVPDLTWEKLKKTGLAPKLTNIIINKDNQYSLKTIPSPKSQNTERLYNFESNHVDSISWDGGERQQAAMVVFSFDEKDYFSKPVDNRNIVDSIFLERQLVPHQGGDESKEYIIDEFKRKCVQVILTRESLNVAGREFLTSTDVHFDKMITLSEDIHENICFYIENYLMDIGIGCNDAHDMAHYCKLSYTINNITGAFEFFVNKEELKKELYKIHCTGRLGFAKKRLSLRLINRYIGNMDKKHDTLPIDIQQYVLNAIHNSDGNCMSFSSDVAYAVFANNVKQSIISAICLQPTMTMMRNLG